MQQSTLSVSHDEALLLGLLATRRMMTLRTKFVKMVYLLDHTSFQQLGHQLTSFDYQWDHYGPNATGNQIKETLDSLVQRGLVTTMSQPTPYDHDANYYEVTETVDSGAIPLTAYEWAFIDAICQKYGPMSREQIVRASKETEPVLNARQYDGLKFVQDPDIEAKKAGILADEPLMSATLSIFKAGKVGTPLEEVRAYVRGYGQAGMATG